MPISFRHMFRKIVILILFVFNNIPSHGQGSVSEKIFPSHNSHLEPKEAINLGDSLLLGINLSTDFLANYKQSKLLLLNRSLDSIDSKYLYSSLGFYSKITRIHCEKSNSKFTVLGEAVDLSSNNIFNFLHTFDKSLNRVDSIEINYGTDTIPSAINFVRTDSTFVIIGLLYFSNTNGSVPYYTILDHSGKRLQLRTLDPISGIPSALSIVNDEIVIGNYWSVDYYFSVLPQAYSGKVEYITPDSTSRSLARYFETAKIFKSGNQTFSCSLIDSDFAGLAKLDSNYQIKSVNSYFVNPNDRTFLTPNSFNVFSTSKIYLSTSENIYSAGIPFDSSYYNTMAFYRLDTSGAVIWKKVIDTNAFYYPTATVTNKSGDVYFTSFKHDSTNLPGQTSLSIYSLDSLGNFLGRREIKLNSINKKLRVYPIPAIQLLNVNWEELEDVTSIQVLNMNGKLIREFHSSLKPLNISEFAEGNYLLKIEDRHGIHIAKFIKKN